MKLSDYANGRDNNFNLIRIVAATAVLVTHSFALVAGSGNAEPLRDVLGMTLGSIAVDVFFLSSGFLVTSSLLTRRSTLDFVVARCLRIVPALSIMLLLSVFLLGTALTSLQPWPYLSDPRTGLYLIRNLTLIGGIEHSLPGLFEANPYRNAVNGSLWTMPWEVRMYAVLALMWLILRVTRDARVRLIKGVVVALAAVLGVWVVAGHFTEHHPGKPVELAFMFFTGASFYVLREKIVLLCAPFGALLGALMVSVLHKDAFFLVYTLSISYLLFYLAYVPAGAIRRYNRLGDYSYGVYIYAFPVQQAIAALVPGVTVPVMVAASGAVTFLLAGASWHLIEKHALGLKGHYVVRAGSLLQRVGLVSASSRARS